VVWLIGLATCLDEELSTCNQHTCGLVYGLAYLAGTVGVSKQVSEWSLAFCSTHNRSYHWQRNSIRYVMPAANPRCRSAWVGFSSQSVCLFVHSISQKRMLPECLNLVQGMTLGYSRSGTVLGVQRSKVKVTGSITLHNNTSFPTTVAFFHIR